MTPFQPIKVTKQQLFAFIAVHARIPPNEPLLKKQSYALFEDGVAFCRMFNIIFSQRMITPVITSLHTNSLSSRAQRNWKSLQRALESIGVPCGILQREYYTAAYLTTPDSMLSFSGLVFFYFMFHLVRKTDFSAEFHQDVSDVLLGFLQSVDSVRALVLGGNLSVDRIPADLKEYCTTPAVADTKSTAAVVASRSDDDYMEEDGNEHSVSYKNRLRGGDSTSQVSSVELLDRQSDLGRADTRPYDDPRWIYVEEATPPIASRRQHVTVVSSPACAAVRSLFPSEDGDRGGSHQTYYSAGTGDEEDVLLLNEKTPPTPMISQHHAATPVSMRHYTPKKTDTAALGARLVSETATMVQSKVAENDDCTAATRPHAKSLQVPHMVGETKNNVPCVDLSDHGAMLLSVDVDEEAAAIQQYMLKSARCDGDMVGEADAAQQRLWRLLSAYHVVESRCRRYCESDASTRVSLEVANVKLTEANEANERLEAALRQFETRSQSTENELKRALEASNTLATERQNRLVALESDMTRLHRQLEASHSKSHLRRRCTSLECLCGVLRELDQTSMDLLVQVVERDDEDTSVIEHLTTQRAALQEKVQELVKELQSIESSPMGRGSEEEEDEQRLVQEALEERIRSATVSRDALMDDLRRVSDDAVALTAETTRLRGIESKWSHAVSEVDASKGELRRREEVIGDLRSKLSSALAELDTYKDRERLLREEHQSIWSVSPPATAQRGALHGSSRSRRGNTSVMDVIVASPDVRGNVDDLNSTNSIPIFRLHSPSTSPPPVLTNDTDSVVRVREGDESHRSSSQQRAPTVARVIESRPRQSFAEFTSTKMVNDFSNPITPERMTAAF